MSLTTHTCQYEKKEKSTKKEKRKRKKRKREREREWNRRDRGMKKIQVNYIYPRMVWVVLKLNPKL
jgi:hypothetical protein